MTDVVESHVRPDLEAQFQALYTSGLIGILRADTERILDANDAFLEMVGYTREELEAGVLHWPEMTPAEYRELDARALEDLVATGACAPFEKECIRKDGSRVPILLAGVAAPGSQDGWVCYVLDLSAAKRAATTDRTLATIIERVPVGIIVVDAGGRLLLMNEAGRRISGGSPGKIEAVAEQAGAYAIREPGTGRPLAPEETPIALALAGEIVENFEYVFHPEGAVTDSWVRVVAVPLTDDQGQGLGAVAVFEDVTAERFRERARDDFLSAVTHDLKSPLTAIKGFAQLLERRLARDGALDPDMVRKNLQRIRQTTTRMEDLISELLDVARLQAGEDLELVRRQIDLVELVRRVTEEYAQASEIHTVRLETAESSIVGVWDAARLERVVENIVGNAIAYSPNGGSVIASLSREAANGRDWAVLRVEDQGIGIPAADVPRIFERFYRGSNVTARFTGTGIGLAGVRQIVEQHDGSVAVESQENVGSTFIVRLPLAEVGDQARETTSAPGLGSKT